MKKCIIIVIDGPPASGKTTIANILASRFCNNKFSYKRLGLINVFTRFILRLAPSLLCHVSRGDRTDPVILVSTQYLEKVMFFNMVLELIYKYIRHLLLTLSTMLSKCMTIDEGLSLSWANYFVLILYKKALKPKYIELLMSLDLMFLKLLSKIRKVRYYFIDRDIAQLELFWHRRGNCGTYDIRFLFIVRYAFNLLANVYNEYGINMKVKYVYITKSK